MNPDDPKLTLKEVFAYPCPTCGAAVGTACGYVGGPLMAKPHRAREQFATREYKRSINPGSRLSDWTDTAD